ncbi:UvrD-helicase domain-containing protein [Fulvivirga lutea]|uniref:DNA 3'-5' helicase n=1 Tax=Fulvivirga lutea TaxID=2810512 RepID=A0A975A0B8_9BACT|nr:UvrD-helicase domain-containing protein [Fulvivirga lutea]QSE97030.1 UvrD-helicase domain-containing protein [Fulvivirga lutea]
MQQPFLIYRSSAGSGKTYTLAKSYLKLALVGKNRFRRILGVTFTNKATEEMKQRIIKFLTLLKEGKEPTLAKELSGELGIDETILKQRAADVLSEILHNYSRFSVVTIDSFFHQVIRSFAREMGLQGTFTIDLDTDKVMQEVIDRMLSEIGDEEHKEIKSWLTQFAEEKVEEGTSWDFRKDISKLAKEVLKDDFKGFSEKINEAANSPEQLSEIKKQLDHVQLNFEKELADIGKRALNIIEENGLTPESFKGRSKSVAKLFLKVQGQDYGITATNRKAIDDISQWVGKADDQSLLPMVENQLMPLHNEIIDYFDTNFIEYQSAIEVKRYFYTFGILSYINRYLQIYRDENEVMLISDLPDFLNKIISDSDTPFIYEKVGSRFDHYLIDEFQDTSSYQWNNFKPLVKNATDQGQFCMVVGDAKQSIYRFRGGDWKLLQHQVKYDIGEVMTNEQNLDTNWRSSANIIDFNNDIFERLKPLMQKNYITNASQEIDQLMNEVLSSFNESFQKLPAHKPKDHGLVELSFLELEKDTEEKYRDLAIEYTISKVEQLQQAGYALRDIAILTRTSREGKDVARAFIERSNSELAKPHLKYDVVSKEALFLTASHVVQFIISVIKWLHDEKNAIELAHWYSTYQKYVVGNHENESELYLQLANWDKNVPDEFVKNRHQLKSLPLYELVEELCRIFSLSKIKEEYTYLQGFQDAVLEYSKNERGDIASFLVWWEDIRKTRSIIISDDNNAAKILTIHKSKGLEFPVVIIPFLNWSLDVQNYSIDNILWCESVDKAPFNQMPMVPLKYTSALEKTYWANDYHREKLKNLLDNLNILYVAMTRPEVALYMASPLPTKDALNKINDLMLKLIKSESGWNEENNTYTLGKLPAPIKKEITNAEVQLNDYTSHNWRSKVHLQMRDAAAQKEDQFDDAKAFGIKMHDMLSQIHYENDLKKFENNDHAADLAKTVQTLSDYFSESWQVKTEVPVLLPNGEQRRIDRMNTNEKEVVLIDYKTGTPRDKDKSQMKEYMWIIGQMVALPVRGMLLYLEDQHIINVEDGS